MPGSANRREQRRGEILATAREMFCDKGYEQTTVAELAARLGLVEGTIYRYFDSKHALLLAVLTDWYQQMFADYSTALRGVSGARARLHLMIWHHLQTIHEQPQLCQLMFREARDPVSQANAPLRKLNRRYTRFLTQVVEEGMAEGVFRPGLNTALVRDLVYGGIEHHCMRYLSGQGSLDVDAAASRITELLCQGIDHQEPALDGEARRLSSLVSRLESLLPPTTEVNP